MSESHKGNPDVVLSPDGKILIRCHFLRVVSLDPTSPGETTDKIGQELWKILFSAWGDHNPCISKLAKNTHSTIVRLSVYRLGKASYRLSTFVILFENQLPTIEYWVWRWSTLACPQHIFTYHLLVIVKMVLSTWIRNQLICIALRVQVRFLQRWLRYPL